MLYLWIVAPSYLGASRSSRTRSFVRPRGALPLRRRVRLGLLACLKRFAAHGPGDSIAV